jgi:hypothetical protein
MPKEKQSTGGGCLCGAIRYTADGELKGAGYCHCKTCRHHTGAPVVAFVVFSAEQVKWLTGDRNRYESSPGKFRAFCRHCGTSLTFEDDEFIEFHISTLDSPDDHPPNEHTHYADKISWLELADSLPRYRGSIE